LLPALIDTRYSRSVRVAYLIGVLVWLSYTVQDPWFPAEALPDSYGRRGAFGLQVAQGTIGPMVLGFVSGIWYHLRRSASRDGLLQVFAAVSLGLFAGWLGLGVFTVVSIGLALTEPLVVCGILAVGAILGAFYGMWRWPSPAPAPSVSPAPVAPSRTESRQPSALGSLAWFVTGLVAAVLLSVPVFMLDAAFPRPGTGEWGIRPFNSWVGPLLWILGAGGTAGLWRLRLRPLAIGLGIGALVIGLLPMLQ
jgi:hypothetical protein